LANLRRCITRTSEPAGSASSSGARAEIGEGFQPVDILGMGDEGIAHRVGAFGDDGQVLAVLSVRAESLSCVSGR
jgi:hypothetical protein